MKLRTALFLAPFLAAPLAGACKSPSPSAQADHWHVDSVPERMVKHFTGYRRDLDGQFIDYQYGKKKHVNHTLRRHFLNNSPEAPVSPDDPSLTARRPPHSVAPDPLYDMGAESVFVGLALLGMTGSFIPIPIDSIVATVFSDGGWSEFGRGFTEGADADAEQPPGVSRFEVKNR